MQSKHLPAGLISVRNLVHFLLFVSLAVVASCRPTETKTNFLSAVTTFYGAAEKIGEPFGVATRSGDLFVSDGENGRLLKISKDGSAVVLTDKLNTPSHIAFDKNGDLIVADSGSHTIRRVKTDGTIETVAGTENKPGFRDGETSAALFYAPIGIAVAGDKIYVADTYNDRIRVIENGQVRTLAGSTKGFADGEGAAARFDTPTGIAVLANGSALVADGGNRRIRSVANDGRVVTLAGNGSSELVDGSFAEAAFVQPTAVTVSPNGTVFIADGNALRMISGSVAPQVLTITNQRRGYSDGALKESRFNRVSGIAVDESGNLFVADSENQVVRAVSGQSIGQARTSEEIEKSRITAAEFRKLSEPRWSYDPPEKLREIAGTLGEVRGERKGDSDQVWFHNGLDIVGGFGETARFVRSEKVLRPMAAENFGTLRELLRLPTLGYIHIRLGRDKDERSFNDPRFIFSKDETGKPDGIRVPRGASFKAGEAIGTLNAMNHVHLIAGRSGGEMNALDALSLPGASDKIAPVIENIRLFDKDWRALETQTANARITLDGKTRIVAKAYDRMDGNAERRRLGVFSVGYQLLKEDKSPVFETRRTIRFDRLPEPDAVFLVYAEGSKSGATGETIFNYIATNRIHGNVAAEDFFDPSEFPEGNYLIRVVASDYFGNSTSKDIAVSIVKR